MHLKSGFLALVTVLTTVSGISAASLPERSLVARAVCPELCDPVTNYDAQCKTESNYDKCFCKIEMLVGIDNCFACLVMNLEANDALNSVLTGGGGVVGGSADSIRAAGQRTHNQMIAGCQAAGYALDGSGSSSGDSGTTGSGNSGAATSTTATGGNQSSAGTKLKELGGVSVLLLAAGVGSLL
ncbi:hypothetical protein H1R20_g15507, partial [Candolleomyces eurysporus]